MVIGAWNWNCEYGRETLEFMVKEVLISIILFFWKCSEVGISIISFCSAQLFAYKISYISKEGVQTAELCVCVCSPVSELGNKTKL